MINEKNIERVKNEIKKLIGKGERNIIVRAQNLEFNRKILEYGRFDVLVGIEQSFDIGKDKLKQVDSGLNHVLAKIAAKNGVAIGIDLEFLRGLEGKKKALILEKIIQNIKVCRKAHAKIKLLNYKDEKDAFGFLLSLGADTKQAKESLNKTNH